MPTSLTHLKDKLQLSQQQIMLKVKQSSQWLRTKFKRGKETEHSSPRCISIGSPTNFRRADVTLGTDCEGRPVLVEQAREDTKSLFHASQSPAAERHVKQKNGGGDF